MAFPAGILASTIKLGPYTDAAGAVALAGLHGSLRPSSPIVHVKTGQVIVPAEVPIVIGPDGTATVGPVVRAGQDGVTVPADFTYSVDWQASSFQPTPGRRTFQLPADSPEIVDFDRLTEVPEVPGVLVPTVPGPPGPPGSAVVDNGDGTFTASGYGVVDNDDGTFTISA